MRLFLTASSALPVFSFAALLLCRDAQAQVVIDNFDKNQAVLSQTAVGNVSSTVTGSMPGGERDEKVTVTTAGTITAEVKNGTYIFTQAAGAVGNAEIVWDGTDGNGATINTTGLGALNLTTGAQDALLLGILSANQNVSATLTIYSSAGTRTFTFTIPAGTTPNYLSLAHSVFTGAGNFTAVGAIQLVINSNPGANVVLDFLRTSATASAPPVEATLTDVVLIDNDANGKASPGDTLRYIVRIKNNDVVAKTGVAFSAATPANTTLGAVATAPLARNDAPIATSVPGNAFHTPFNSALTVAPNDPNQNLLVNDFVGTPAAAITKFGGGILGGTVDSNNAGGTASTGGHSLTMNADGSFTYIPASGFTGLFTTQYRLANASGSATATLTIAVGERPNAVADAHPVTGNIRIDTSTAAPFSVLDNDDGDGVTINLDTFGTTGTVTINSSGQFVYTPQRGKFSGTDIFSYTLSNGFGTTAAAAVTINFDGNIVWFIDNSGTPPGDGRSHSPYSTIALFNTANATGTAGDPANGQHIFLRRGTGVAYSDGITLRNSQVLLGDGWPGDFSTGFGFTPITHSVVTPPIGADPIISPASGNGVNLGTDNIVRGLIVNNSAGFGFSGGAVGNLTIADVSKTGTGGAISITTSGTFGTSVNFDVLESTSSAGANLNLVGVTGTLAANSWGAGFSGSAATFAAINISSGSVSFTDPAGVTKSTTGALLNVAGGHTGTLTFQTGTLSATSGTGLQFDNADGAYNFNGTTTLNGGDAGVDILNGSSGTFAFGSGVAISNPSGIGFNMLNSNGSVSYAGTISKNNAGRAISVDNHDGNNNVTFSGSISSIGTSGGILVQNCGTGTVAFSNGTKTLNTGANAAVTLASNTGATINFTGGGLDIDTSTGAGFTAIAGGTINVTGNGNSINSVSATALNVANTTIGASGLNFHDISSGNNTAAADPANGIVLNATGGTGGLTVSGDGITTVGGNSSGGTIQNTTSDGISLTSTFNPSFTNMNIHDTFRSGIDGTDVTNFTFANGKIERSGLNGSLSPVDTGSGGVDVSCIAFNDIVSGINNLDGVVSITNNQFTNPWYHGVDIYNESGSISDLTVSGNTVTATGLTASSKGSGIRVNENGSASTGATLTKGTVALNTIDNFASGSGIMVQGGNTASGPQSTLGIPDGSNIPGAGVNIIVISGNIIGVSSVAGGIGSNPIQTAVTGTGQGNFSIINNGTAAQPLQHFLGMGINASGGNVANVNYLINNNYINASDNIANSSGMSVGSQLGIGQTGTIRATITNNNISGMEGNGILAGVINSGNTGIFKINNNTVGAPQAGVRPGIRVESGSSSGDTDLALEIAGNVSAGSGGSQGIGLRKQGTSTTVNIFGIEGLTPSPTGSPNVENHVNTLNPAGNGTLLISATTGFTSAIVP